LEVQKVSLEKYEANLPRRRTGRRRQPLLKGEE
jgi:hypothetical protein